MTFTAEGVMAEFNRIKALDPAEIERVTIETRDTLKALELFRDCLQGTLSQEARRVTANRTNDILGPGQWQGLDWRALDFGIARLLRDHFAPLIDERGQTYAAALMAGGPRQEKDHAYPVKAHRS